jgi:membrane protease YdiL (CAAX protease family)
MTGPEMPVTRAIPAAVIIHQEGVIALIALVGVWLRDDGFAAAFSPPGGLASSILSGAGAGLVCFLFLWLVRAAGPLRDLEDWQRRMVEGWTTGDAAAVAVFSGLAEEALIRALLQPLIGLVPAAVVFAVLHIVPDRRLWIWPLMALLLGVAIGWVFARWGYPAAAAAHVVINGLSLSRFRAMARS